MTTEYGYEKSQQHARLLPQGVVRAILLEVIPNNVQDTKLQFLRLENYIVHRHNT